MNTRRLAGAIRTTRYAICAAAFIFPTLCAVPAGAQGLIPHVAVHAGVFLPQSKGMKAVGGSTWFDFGGDITLPVGIPLLGSSHIQLDYISSSKSHIIPVVFVQTLQPSAVVARSPVYAGLGFGFWNVAASGGVHGTAAGVRLLAGLDLGPQYYAEARYDVVSRISGLRIDGFSVSAGLHF